MRPLQPRVSLRWKITALIAALILSLGIVVVLLMRQQIAARLGERLDQEGVAIAEGLAAQGADLILINDVIGLHDLAHSVRESYPEVRYVMFLDPQGRAIAHTFHLGPPDMAPPHLAPPQGLEAANLGPGEGRGYNIALLDTEEGILRDVALPILGGKAGMVRVGLSEQGLREAVASATRDILLATALALLAAMIAAFFLAARLTRPILRLVKAAQAVGAGDLSQQAPVESDDEIGNLSASFNAMTRELARSREAEQRDMAELRRMEKELRARNRELSSLNAISAAVSQSLDVEQCLAISLGQVLELMGAEAGWVDVGEVGGSPVKVAQGLSSEALARLAPGDATPGEEVAPPVTVREAQTPVPIPGLAPYPGTPLLLARVPLLSKGKALGTLNLLTQRQHLFTPQDVRLLEAIGQQIGPAIENAQLYAQAQHMAILEERDRLAREMHDGLAQVLGYLNLKSRMAEQALEAGDAARARHDLEEMQGVADDAYNDVREAILGLRASLAPGRGLLRTVAEYLDKFTRQTNIPTHLALDGTSDLRFSPRTEIQLLRIIQEALTNVRKHAPGSSAWVRFDADGHQAKVTIQDNGPGFDPEVAMGEGRARYGLHTMKERAQGVGGQLHIQSRPGQGTRVIVTLPLERRPDRDQNTSGG